MKQGTIVRLIVMAILCEKCFAVDPLEERATQLASALNISTNTTERLSYHPIFTGKETVRAGEFQVKKKRIIESLPEKPIDVDILDTNGQVVAAGRIIECSSFEMARTALLRRLVLNSMGIEMVAQMHEVRDGDVGELCIVKKTFDNVSKKYTSDPAVIHFLRGGTAVSLYSTEKGNDLWETAKTLDATLSEISGVGKPLSIPESVP